MRSDSPPLSWYEPPDEIEDDELVDVPHEDFVIGAGTVSWYSLLAYDADDL